MTFLKILLAIVIILLIVFVVWFVRYRKCGKCPICAIQKTFIPTKVTINTEGEDNYANNAQKTPIMGWSSWNTFRQNITEDLVLETATAMKNSGLLEAGYEYINLDDCWQSSLRDSNGNWQGDVERFSSGIPALINKVNSMGMKVGLYSSNGTLTCEDLPASLGREAEDAKTLATWGAEFFKYDFCHHNVIKGDTPVIEGLEINVKGQPKAMTLMAEDARLEGKARIIDVKALPSGKGIGMLNHGAGRATFSFETNFSGVCYLTILTHKVITHHEQYLQVIVNGELNEVFFPKTRASSPTGRTQISIKLHAGENTIVLQNPIKTFADSSYTQYSRMGRELQKAVKNAASEFGTGEKPIVYSICEWGNSFPWKWGPKAGNMWRTTPDIMPKWYSVNGIYRHNIKLYESASPGHWNDPDMLEVGVGDFTEEENKTHFSLWCMMAAPLVLGNDIRKFVGADGEPLNNSILKIVTNEELIAIDQDKLVKQAKIVARSRKIDVIARPLANGDIAVCFYNRGGAKGFSYDINEIASDEYLNFNADASTYTIRDLWSGENFSSKTISATLEKHACKVYRILKV